LHFSLIFEALSNLEGHRKTITVVISGDSCAWKRLKKA